MCGVLKASPSEGAHSRDGEKSTCLIDIHLARQIGRKKIGRKKVSLVMTLIMVKAPNLDSFKGEVKVSHEPGGSLLSSAQNTSHATAAPLGEPSPEPPSPACEQGLTLQRFHTLCSCWLESLDHRWQTPGPQAASGPPPCFIQPLFLYAGSAELSLNC